MRAVRILAVCCLFLAATPSRAQDTREQRAGVEGLASALVRELSTLCPIADPGDMAAFDRCRHGLFRPSSLLRLSLNTIVLWGRPHPDGEALEKTNLTQFAPEAWTGLYAPTFMFDGSWAVEYDERERLYRARLGALFRNALPPGQYAYPFWHSAKKWNDYQSANAVVLWIRGETGTVVAGQFTVDTRQDARLRSTPVTRPPFDGQWMWTDSDGTIQPQPTLFRGLFADDNPYLPQLEPSYRELATALRKGHCADCHVPNNPNGLRRLVLLQTPAHAAAEIKRVMRAVRQDDMPIDDGGLYREIDADTKATLLKQGAAFEALIDAARAWERSR